MSITSHLKYLGLASFFIAPSLLAKTSSSFASPASSQRVVVDGSSTVFPISEAVAEEFHNSNAGVSVTVGVSGTGGGFKKFLGGEVDIVNASRPIKASELEVAQKNGLSLS